jgi:hypothetical protein
MKKVVRLTENDLIRIVKRVINEERYPEDSKDSPKWFKYGNQSKGFFDTYRNKTGRPFKVKTRRPRKD